MNSVTESSSSRLSSSATDQQKRAFFTLEVRRLCSVLLPPYYRQKFDDSTIQALVEILLQGTVVEIIKELREVQRITENNLYQMRSRTVAQQEARRKEMLSVKQKIQPDCSTSGGGSGIVQLSTTCLTEPHDPTEQRRREEQEALKRVDMKNIMELDQLAAQQQLTLERAGVPLFFMTNKAEDIRLQMYLLEIVAQITHVG